jgi:hypothetical protein
MHLSDSLLWSLRQIQNGRAHAVPKSAVECLIDFELVERYNGFFFRLTSDGRKELEGRTAPVSANR